MTKSRWSGAAVAEVMGAEVHGIAPDAVTGVSIDSRTLEPGDAFFAIRGDNHDGHDFVAGALVNGAAVGVIAADRLAELSAAQPLFVVPDVLKALEALAREVRSGSRARIVAVTGSVGKTGTKEMLRHMLERQGETHAARASFNNHWGVPLTLARLPPDAAYGVFEIGMNHTGEITPLAKMVHPHVAIVTTVEAVHVANFPSVEAIADAKAEIFFGLEKGGVAVLNRENRFFERLRMHARAAGARIASFGLDEASDARLMSLQTSAEGSRIEASIDGIDLVYRLAAPGKHLAMNSLAALIAIKRLGGDVERAALALADFHAPKGRGERIALTVGNGEAVLYDESYNANPASMRAALDLLALAPVGEGGRRIAVMGDMLELGPKADEMHRELADSVAACGVDLVYAAGPHMKALFDALPEAARGRWSASSAELTAPLASALRAGDAVMVKGSFGSRMGPIVDALGQRFAAGDGGRADGRDE